MPAAAATVPASRRWSLTRGARETLVHRPVGVHFDLDGVAKGWLADRALEHLRGHLVAVVDADGDLAVDLGPGASMAVGVEDPDQEGEDLVVLRLEANGDRPTRYGIATSGISNHAWGHGHAAAHHLIDPRTGLPARTDLVQATVIARSARLAEAMAKAAVIVGSRAAEIGLDRPDVLGVVLLTTDRRLLLTPGTTRFVQ